MAFFDEVDPGWTARALLPCLSWEKPDAGALWQARVQGEIGSARLFNALKTDFLSAFRHNIASGRQAGNLAYHLLQVANWTMDTQEPADIFDLTLGETRDTLAATSRAVRHQASWRLWQWMSGEKVTHLTEQIGGGPKLARFSKVSGRLMWQHATVKHRRSWC